MYYTQHQSAVNCPPSALHHHHNRYLPRLHAAFTSIRGHLPAQHQSMSTPLSATMGGTCRAPQKSTRAPQLEVRLMRPQFTPAASVNKSGAFGAVHSAGELAYCRLQAPRRSVSLPRESQEASPSTTNTHGHTNKADDIESASPLLTVRNACCEESSPNPCDQYPAGAASVCRLLEIAASRLRESQNRWVKGSCVLPQGDTEPRLSIKSVCNDSGGILARCRTAAIRLLTRALLRLEESSKRDAFLTLNPRVDPGQHLGDLRRVHELADELESYLATFSADFKSPSSHRPTRE